MRFSRGRPDLCAFPRLAKGCDGETTETGAADRQTGEAAGVTDSECAFNGVVAVRALWGAKLRVKALHVGLALSFKRNTVAVARTILSRATVERDTVQAQAAADGKIANVRRQWSATA